MEIQFNPEHRLLIIFGESLPHFPTLNELNDMIRLKAYQRYLRLFPFQQLQIFKYRQKTMTREAASMKTMTQLRVDLAVCTVSESSLK
jgi:hypothetical protein